MDAEALFRANLAVIDRVIGEVCRRGRLPPAEVEDFASAVRLALIENDYEILRRWQGRATLAGYLNIVIRRLLADRRDRDLGRWYPSVDAVRMGDSGVLLEKLLSRDGRALEEALPLVCARDPSLTREAVAAMAAQLPARAGRPRPVALDETSEQWLTSGERADSLALSGEIRRLSRQASEVVRRTMAAWPDEDVLILRFRFGSSMTIADISRMLRVPQRPLYRRIEALLGKLRKTLIGAGLDAAALAGVIGTASQEMDFGFEDGKNAGLERSDEPEQAAAEEGR